MPFPPLKTDQIRRSTVLPYLEAFHYANDRDNEDVYFTEHDINRKDIVMQSSRLLFKKKKNIVYCRRIRETGGRGCPAVERAEEAKGIGRAATQAQECVLHICEEINALQAIVNEIWILFTNGQDNDDRL